MVLQSAFVGVGLAMSSLICTAKVKELQHQVHVVFAFLTAGPPSNLNVMFSAVNCSHVTITWDPPVGQQCKWLQSSNFLWPHSLHMARQG